MALEWPCQGLDLNPIEQALMTQSLYMWLNQNNKAKEVCASRSTSQLCKGSTVIESLGGDIFI